ncbi:MAG: L-histidine N(alpha)-methyltransferase [Candidatus Magasanikbacteria bacterium]|jgi:L-histidine Nalpha-methyltransferase|nr:L-histidine N(alpha)-methyltransferase [Candidatus Magasanikbacteria bacterium]
MDTHVSHPGVAQEHQTFCDDVLSGLSQPQKELPCKYFYDEHGSKLFDKICRLDEYYPTRTEMALLGSNGEEIADLIGPGVCLIEYGCGSLDKTRLLIDALDRPSLFVPIDISEDHLINSARALAEDYQELDVRPLVADFTQTLDLPQEVEEGSTKRVGFFPGSTIGNFDHQAAEIFLRTVFETIGEGGGLLIGVDMKKNEETLIRAYDDAEGVTAAFNLNVIERINRELDGNFDVSAFRHRAMYNPEKGRVEMHLVSLKAQTVHIQGAEIGFAEGETIHTENSYKYHPEEFTAMAAKAGFFSEKTWVDDNELFSLHYLTVRP